MKRKIEAALEEYFRLEGWNLVNTGDHFAVKYVWPSENGPLGEGEEFSINLTACAKRVAEELEAIKC